MPSDGIKRYRLRLKRETLEAYGGCQCKCCGENDLLFLTLDHINNNGSEARRLNKRMGTDLYRHLKKEGWPLGLQVLCWNCNRGKWANGGICPHKSPARIPPTKRGQHTLNRVKAAINTFECKGTLRAIRSQLLAQGVNVSLGTVHRAIRSLSK